MNWENQLSETAKAAQASDIRELLKLTAQPNMISLAGGLPDPGLFPLEEYQSAMSRVMQKFGPRALQYSPTEGVNELRHALIKVLDRQGVICPQKEENILLTSGSQQALELLGKAFINPDDTILIEAPTYVGALQAFSPRQPRFEVVEMDAEGVRLDSLEDRLVLLKREGRQPKFFYIIPTFQNPTGRTLSLARRKALLEIAARENLLIIEDDPYSRIRFTGENVPNLKSLDTKEQVILLQTFSKTLAPGLRTGYVVGSPQVLQRLAILKQGADLCSSALNQFILFEMLEAGAMERYIQTVVNSYRVKAQVMIDALQESFGYAAGEVTWNEPQGGMFLWVQLPYWVNSSRLLPKALEAGVAYVKGSAFYPEQSLELGANSLRLNFSQPSPLEIKTGIMRLASVIQKNFATALLNSVG